jgi:hypothetical protein
MMAQHVQLSHQVPIEIICSRTSRIKQIALTLGMNREQIYDPDDPDTVGRGISAYMFRKNQNIKLISPISNLCSQNTS